MHSGVFFYEKLERIKIATPPLPVSPTSLLARARVANAAFDPAPGTPTRRQDRGTPLRMRVRARCLSKSPLLSFSLPASSFFSPPVNTEMTKKSK